MPENGDYDDGLPPGKRKKDGSVAGHARQQHLQKKGFWRVEEEKKKYPGARNTLRKRKETNSETKS